MVSPNDCMDVSDSFSRLCTIVLCYNVTDVKKKLFEFLAEFMKSDVQEKKKSNNKKMNLQ